MCSYSMVSWEYQAVEGKIDKNQLKVFGYVKQQSLSSETFQTSKVQMYINVTRNNQWSWHPQGNFLK